MLNFLTEEEVRNIAVKSFDTKELQLCDYKIEPMSDNQMGFLGEHFRLMITVDLNNVKETKSYFIKTVPRDNPDQLEYVVKSGAFMKEIDAYNQLFPEIHSATSVTSGDATGAWHPTHYYSRSDILVLEDLSEKNFILSPLDAFDMDHVKIALKTVASMHGQCLVFEEKISRGEAVSSSPELETVKDSEKIEIKDLYPSITKEIVYCEDDPESPFIKWMNIGVDEITVVAELLEGFNDKQRAVIKTELRKIIFSVYKLAQYSSKFKNTYNQGDLWANNILFRYQDEKPVEARIVDFQLARYIPLTHDAMEIFYLTTTREFRENHEKEVRRYYYLQLQFEVGRYGYELENIITWDSFLECWEHYRKLGLIRAAILLNIVLTPPDVLNSAFSTVEDYKNFILHQRSLYIRKCFQMQSYKQRVSEIFHEIIERYIPL